MVVYHNITPRQAEVCEELGLGVNYRYSIGPSCLSLTDRGCRYLQASYHRGVFRPSNRASITYFDSTPFCLQQFLKRECTCERIRVRVCVYYDADISCALAHLS